MNEPFVIFWTQVWQVTIVAVIVLFGVKLLGKKSPTLGPCALGASVAQMRHAAGNQQPFKPV